MDEPTGIVVAVDGSRGSQQAVRYAVHEAARSGEVVSLVHVIPDYVPLAPMRPLPPDDLNEVGLYLLSQAGMVAAQAAPRATVESRLLAGDRVNRLVEASGSARLLVTGHETIAAWARVFTGAVTLGVAARAECPVVAVPDSWGDRDSRGTVLAGFKSAEHDEELLGHAFLRSGERGARLTILHAWELPGYYDDIIVRRTHDAEWNRAALERIEAQIASLRAAHPDVEVDVRVVHGQPALALRQASLEADLLLLARRGGTRSPFQLGNTARALLREAACPVEVVPAAQQVWVGSHPSNP